MTAANKRWVVSEWTTEVKKNLRLVEEPKPALEADDEVLVNIIVRPVNPSDFYSVASRTEGAKSQRPLGFVPGLEGLGRVVELGKATTGKFKEGQRVVGVFYPARTRGQGTWQQWVSVPEKDLLAVPEGVDDQAASQYLVNPVTAYGLLHAAAAPQGEYLLQTAAGSVLGRILIALAKRQGLKTINVVRRSEQKQELLDLGADVVIATDKEDVVAEVKKLTGGKGAYAAFDAVAGKLTGQAVASVREEGTVFVYGALSGDTLTVEVLPLLYASRKVIGYAVYQWLASVGADREKHLQAVWDAYLDGTIKPYTGETFPFEKAVEAVAASNAVARGGKVLLEG